MTHKKLLTLLLFLSSLLVLNIAYAENNPAFYAKLNTDKMINIDCRDDVTGICDTSYDCNITIEDPDSNILVLNNAMTKNSSVYSYLLKGNNISQYGDYINRVTCYNGTYAESSNFFFRVNEQGKGYVGYNLLGVYLIILVLSIGYLYSAFNINKVHYVSKSVLFFMGLINLVGGLLLGYFDSINAGVSQSLLIMFEINSLAIIFVIVLVMKQLIFDAAQVKQSKEDSEVV